MKDVKNIYKELERQERNAMGRVLGYLALKFGPEFAKSLLK
jgi:hypothetical protein